MSLARHWDSRGTGVVVVSLGHGDLLLESLRGIARDADIHTGVIMTGIGSLTRGTIHWVSSNDLPPTNEYITLEGPLEMVSFCGIIANYEPHVHINLMTADRQYYGGHLEEGCSILTLAELSVLRLSDLRLTRSNRDGSTASLLDDASD
jgi:predicted DNA-binding protein with PD1-like motif